MENNPTNTLILLLLLFGSFFSFTAGIGLIKFSNLLSRLHAQSKPQTTGLLLVVLSFAIQKSIQGNLYAVFLIFLVLLFQIITIPAATITLSWAGYKSKHFNKSVLFYNDLIKKY